MKQSAPWLSLASFLVITFAVAGFGSYFTGSSVATWYPTLSKPTWTPPNWAFSPVWTVLYVMMATAGWIVWMRGRSSSAAVALGLFAVQLVLNAAWSWLFFGMRSVAAGLVDIALLWCAILATIIAFWRVSVLAGALMMPYLLWVSYAAALNFVIWKMNG